MTYCSPYSYCEPLSTWATIDDLYERFGDEFIDKLAIRRVWDETLEQYVADESQQAKNTVIHYALCDAKAIIKQKLSCLFVSVNLLDTKIFPAIKIWHMKMTIEILKVGGDCLACTECNAKLDEWLKCNTVCSEDGDCLISKQTFIEVSESKFPCECEDKGCCKC